MTEAHYIKAIEGSSMTIFRISEYIDIVHMVEECNHINEMNSCHTVMDIFGIFIPFVIN